MLLTKHEGVRFENTTVYISGQAFVNCTFIGCTLVLREAAYHLDKCTFERCNWHIDRVLVWGDMNPIREIKGLVTMLENALDQHNQQTGQQTGQPASNT